MPADSPAVAGPGPQSAEAEAVEDPGYREDVKLRSDRVYQFITGEGGKPLGAALTKKERNDIAALKERSKKFAVSGNTLLRAVKGKHLPVLRSWPEVVRAVTKVHEEGGHFGRTAVHDVIKDSVWWHGNMELDVYEVIKGCRQCQLHSKHNPTRIVPPMMHVDYRKELLGLVAIDLKRLPKTADGNVYVLTMVDYFTKYTWAVPLRSKHADEVVRAILCAVWLEHGAPTAILSDNGKEFKNALFAKVKERYGVEQRYISPSHPQSNGLCERMNNVICTVLSKITLAAHPPTANSHAAALESVSNWDKHLADAVQLYSQKKSSATGVSPYQLVYGRKPCTWVGRALGYAVTETSSELYDPLTADDEAELVAKALSTRGDVEQYATQRQAEKNRQNKQHYDAAKATGPATLAIGDEVVRQHAALT